MNILLFDIEISGHHIEYIEHLVNYIVSNKKASSNSRYFFIVNPDFLAKSNCSSLKYENISFISVTREEYARSKRGLLARSSINYYKLLKKYAREIDAKLCILLYFNIFQLALAFCRPRFKIKGILFMQFFRQEQNTFSQKLKYFRKYCLTYLISKNKSIDTVFILNDTKAVQFMNKTFRTTMFDLLEDPILIVDNKLNINIRKLHNIDEQKRLALHIGSISERKGTLEILDSIAYMPKASKICLLIVGKASDRFEIEINNKIEKYKIKYDCQIIRVNEFISNEMMQSFLEASNIILMPYKNTEASSGILGHAALVKKPVIATGKGLIKEIVETYNLGILIEDVCPKLIAKAIVESESFDIDKSRSDEYINLHSPSIFAGKVLKTNENRG